MLFASEVLLLLNVLIYCLLRFKILTCFPRFMWFNCAIYLWTLWTMSFIHQNFHKKNYIVSHECKQSPNPSDVESFIRLSNFKYFASEYVGKKWVITARILSIEFSVDTLYSFLDVRFQTRILSIFSSGFSIYLSNLIGLSVFWG